MTSGPSGPSGGGPIDGGKGGSAFPPGGLPRGGLPRDDQPPGGQPPGDQPPGGSGSPGASDDLQLSILGVRSSEGDGPGELLVELDTSRGTLQCHLHPCEGQTGCAIFVSGAAGGVDGPANSVFTRLSRDLVGRGVTSLRVRYREPGEFEECVLDALAACSFLKGLGAERAVLVGHSFGGAVAIKAGELGPLVSAVAGMSSQRHGTQTVEVLGKPLLLIHGDRDEVLDRAASDDIYARATEPRRLEIMDGAGHVLTEAADRVYDLLSEFITEHAGGNTAS